MKDVVFYLKDREEHPEHYVTSKGIFTSGNMGGSVSSEQQITRDNYKDFVRFVKQQLKEEKGIMTISEAMELIQIENLRVHIRRENLKAYQYRGRYMVMKKDLTGSYLRAVRENRNFLSRM